MRCLVLANRMKSTMRNLFTVLALFTSGYAFAQIPNAISYQGILVNSTGDPVADGPHTIKFRVYNAPTGGNFQWETSVIEVNTVRGLFVTIISVPDNATWTQPLYVEVVADGQEQGRIQLTTVPYAFRAATAIAMDAGGLTGTLNDARLTPHLQDLADGSLSGSKVGEGINASNITTGTLPSAVMPPNAVTGSGAIGQLAHWSGTNQLAADGLIWDAADNELGIGNAAPVGSISITHGPSHPVGTALGIDNTWDQAGIKTGVDINLTSNSSGTSYGINAKVNSSGTGLRYGVSSTVSSGSTNTDTMFGIAGYTDGQGGGEHRGVYGQAAPGGSGEQFGVYGETTGTGTGIQNGVYGKAAGAGGVKHGVRGSAQGTTATKYGVRGEASGSGIGVQHYGVYGTATGGLTNYGVYGSASGAGNFAVYSNGNFHTVGDITYTGSVTKTSDRKLKKNIAPLASSLEKVLQLKPSTYYFRTDEYATMNLSEGKQIGLIAQEIETVFPELVSMRTNAMQQDEQGNTVSPQIDYKSVDYVSLIPILIKSIQEQQQIINRQQNAIDELKADAARAKGSEKKSLAGTSAVKASVK